MLLDVIVPIDGFANETVFEYKKIDDFFSIIKIPETNEEIRLMSFGALKSLNFEFPQDFAQKMQIDDYRDISVFYIFVLQENPMKNSMDTFSPVIINHKANKIGQIHLNLEELGLEGLDMLLPKF